MPSGGFSLDSHALSDEAMAPTACVTCTAVGWSLFWKGCCYGGGRERIGRAKASIPLPVCARREYQGEELHRPVLTRPKNSPSEATTMPRIKIELIQQILLRLEDSLPDWRGIDVGIEDDQLRSYYVDFLRRDGLVEAKNWGTDQAGDDWKATRLTPDGHRMAEALRTAPGNWRERAKESGEADGLSLTWGMAKRHLSQFPNAKQQEWDVFVSYASEDRESVARPLATILRDFGLRVWYDEMELRVGDNLRRKIDAGLKRCRFGVVILSASFFGKHYPESELSGLDQREQDGGKVILPVWHDVDVAAVRRHSPRLADRVALKWQDGIESVAAGLLEVIAPDRLRAAIERERELTEYVSKTRVPRVTTGDEFTTLLGTYGFFFFNDELRDEAVDLVGRNLPTTLRHFTNPFSDPPFWDHRRPPVLLGHPQR